jgi:dTDP-4-dehydrorhamnose reductase
MREKEALGVVKDQRGSPTWAADLAHAIVDMLRAPGSVFGVYHFTGFGETNWYDFAREIHRLGREKGILERDCELRPIPASEYPTAARRPAYSVLSTEKITRDYGIVARPWKESLADFFNDAFADANGFERIGKPALKNP